MKLILYLISLDQCLSNLCPIEKLTKYDELVKAIQQNRQY